MFRTVKWKHKIILVHWIHFTPFRAMNGLLQFPLLYPMFGRLTITIGCFLCGIKYQISTKGTVVMRSGKLDELSDYGTSLH